MKKFSFNEKYEIYLKASYEIDIIPGIKPSYAKLFRMTSQIEEENAKLRERTLGLKESLIYLKEIKNYFKIYITKTKSRKEDCKCCDSLIKEVVDLRETLGKFTQEKISLT